MAGSKCEETVVVAAAEARTFRNYVEALLGDSFHEEEKVSLSVLVWPISSLCASCSWCVFCKEDAFKNDHREMLQQESYVARYPLPLSCIGRMRRRIRIELG